MTSTIIPIDLGSRSYNIQVGADLFADAGMLLKPFSRKNGVTIVSDENVFAAQGARFTDGLKREIPYRKIILPPGENTKSFDQLHALLNQFLELGLGRDDLIVALGGGVIGDLTGFAASILKRGCKFAQIPTTLLAQVDSSVGGKTGINTKFGKNLIGAFYQPSIVLCDLLALSTLSERDLKSGYAEIVKYAAINDREFFNWLEQNGANLLNGNLDAQQYAVAQSCTKKASIVAADELERGERALLNLGHTFGHAIETIAGYSGSITHGEAVAIGMGMAFDFSVQEGLCSPDAADRFKSHLKKTGLASSIADFNNFGKLPANLNADTMLAAMMQDKKNSDGQLTLILVDGIGKAHIARNTNITNVLSFLNSACQC